MGCCSVPQRETGTRHADQRQQIGLGEVGGIRSWPQQRYRSANFRVCCFRQLVEIARITSALRPERLHHAPQHMGQIRLARQHHAQRGGNIHSNIHRFGIPVLTMAQKDSQAISLRTVRHRLRMFDHQRRGRFEFIAQHQGMGAFGQCHVDAKGGVVVVAPHRRRHQLRCGSQHAPCACKGKRMLRTAPGGQADAQQAAPFAFVMHQGNATDDM